MKIVIDIRKKDWKAIKKLSKRCIKNGDTNATTKALIEDLIRLEGIRLLGK